MEEWKEWQEVTLGEVCETISETISKSSKEVSDKVVLINTSDVLDGKVLNHNLVDNKNLKGQFKKKFQKGDILYSEIRPKNKRFAYINFIPKDYIASTKLMVIRNKENILSEYLYQLLKSETTVNYLQLLAETRSGTFPQITFSEVSNIKINLPSLPEQKAIAKTLSCLDEKIELNQKMNKTLEEMAQAIFKSWFVDFEPFQDGEFVESELGLIPKDWEVDKIENLATITRGASPRPIQDFIRKSGIPWIKISDATSSQSKYLMSTNEFIKEEGVSKSRPVVIGTLILSNSATPGLPMIVNIDACVHDGRLIFNQYNKISKEFLYQYLLKDKSIILLLSNGSVFKNLKTDILKNHKIIVPSNEVMIKITDTLSILDEQILYNCIEIEKLKNIRDTLLPKLMSGEVRVPVGEVE